MARYELISYRYPVPLPSGVWVHRVRCPVCADLHYDIDDGEECICYGCGSTLYVNGLELYAIEAADGTSEAAPREDDCGDEPDDRIF